MLLFQLVPQSSLESVQLKKDTLQGIAQVGTAFDHKLNAFRLVIDPLNISLKLDMIGLNGVKDRVQKGLHLVLDLTLHAGRDTRHEKAQLVVGKGQNGHFNLFFFAIQGPNCAFEEIKAAIDKADGCCNPNSGL